MNVRAPVSLLTLGLAVAATAWTPSLAAQSEDPEATQWVVPRTPGGHPDLQGNWTNATLTPLERPEGQGPILTAAQVAELEGDLQQFIETTSAPSDPEREAPPEGGVSTGGGARLDAAAGGTGGYNIFWLDPGERVAVVDGEHRSSLIVDPPNGRIPPRTQGAQERLRQRAARFGALGQYDNPENRPLAERCIMSFGSNAGPPMLPNYFYNNNYTIVQTDDHVMIMTEMVHDARIVRLGDGPRLPEHVRPWMGDSWGRWEGDTLVVETTNFHPLQVFAGASDDLKVVERFTRVDEHTILYRFTVDDPTTFTRPWSGEVPFTALDGLVYEYACHEGNYALSNVLSGARAQEREAANDNPEAR